LDRFAGASATPEFFSFPVIFPVLREEAVPLKPCVLRKGNDRLSRVRKIAREARKIARLRRVRKIALARRCALPQARRRDLAHAVSRVDWRDPDALLDIGEVATPVGRRTGL
jgi:hypothetical protein